MPNIVSEWLWLNCGHQWLQAEVKSGTAISIRSPVPPESVQLHNSRLLYSGLGYQAHYAQLTQACGYVADRYKLYFVDLYSRLSIMNNQTTNLRDGVHAAWWVGMDAVNTYLNIIKEHRSRRHSRLSDIRLY